MNDVAGNSTADMQSSANNFDVNNMVNGIFGLGKVAVTGYFAEETAKNALQAPTSNTAIVIGGIVLVGVLLVIMLR
jgi:hypothetical protein